MLMGLQLRTHNWSVSALQPDARVKNPCLQRGRSGESVLGDAY